MNGENVVGIQGQVCCQESRPTKLRGLVMSTEGVGSRDARELAIFIWLGYTQATIETVLQPN